MDFKEFKAKNVDDAIMEASINIGVSSDQLVYEIVEKGSNGFFGIAKKSAIIKARAKEEGEMSTKERIKLNDEEMKKCEDAVNKKMAEDKIEKDKEEKKIASAKVSKKVEVKEKKKEIVSNKKKENKTASKEEIQLDK